MTDQLTGLQYLRARYYNPSTGTFNRLDPFFGNLNDPQSLHKHLYAHANPIGNTDPTGEYAMAVFRMIMGIGFWAVARIILGRAAEYTIRQAYLREVNRGALVQTSEEQIGRTTDDDLPPGGFREEFKLKPDILDKGLKTYYEIKSTFPVSVAKGRKDLNEYQAALANRFPGQVYTRGRWNPRQLQYPLQIPGWAGDFPVPMYIRAFRLEPGLLVYSEWDVQRYAIVAGLVGFLAPDAIRYTWRFLRPPGANPGPSTIPFPKVSPGPLPVPLPAAASVGGISLIGGIAGIGGL